MKTIIVFAVSFLVVTPTWAQQSSTAATGGPTETINADNVPIEEYVPKVIIEGKWGAGPGEFGTVSQFPLVASEKKYQPSSLAVDKKGNIYVLDTANNRIEIFNKDGKYLTSIAVESLKGEVAGYCVGKPGEGYCNEEPPPPGLKYDVPIMGMVEVEGINIVIDNKDTLYYYLKRLKDGKETGEVWEFKDDKLIKKHTSAQKGGLPAKFQLISTGYNQFALTVAESPSPSEKHKYHVDIKKNGENSELSVKDTANQIMSNIEIPPTPEYIAAKAKNRRAKSDVYFEKFLDSGNFRIRTVNGDITNIVTEEREYTPKGNLVRRIKSPPGHSHGIEVGETGIKVIHWVIQKGN